MGQTDVDDHAPDRPDRLPPTLGSTSRADDGPAAMRTAPAAMVVPSSSRTPITRSPARTSPATRAPMTSRAPRRSAATANARVAPAGGTG